MFRSRSSRVERARIRPVSPRRARRSGDHSRVRIGHFLHLNRALLAVGAAATAFFVLGVHDTPAQAVTVDEVRGEHGHAAAARFSSEQAGSDSTRAVAGRDAAGLYASTGGSPEVALRVDSRAVPVDSVRDDYGLTRYDLVSWPVDLASPISNPFGRHGHDGTDFTPGLGTPVLSASEGVVVEAGNPEGALGVHLKIRSTVGGESVVFVYGHMLAGSMALREGDIVHRGQQLGRVGSTGASTGPHLHFGVLRGDTPIDPVVWMRAHVNS